MIIYRCDLTLHDILLEACDYVVSRQLTIGCQRSIKVRAITVCYSAKPASGMGKVEWQVWCGLPTLARYSACMAGFVSGVGQHPTRSSHSR